MFFRLLFKVVATVPVVWLLTQSEVLREVARFGPVGGALLALGFFGLVVLFCRDLQRVLERVPAEVRAAPPTSVWWMLVLPFNFVEDFFIVTAVSRSLQRAGLGSPQEPWLGLGWCIAQLLSLLPGVVGLVGGVVAALLWGLHWRVLRAVLRSQ